MIFVSLKSAISPRPASWILERSVDGIDFMPWQYFGASDADCRDRYNLPGQNEPYAFQYDSEAICSIQFAKAIPLENGEVSGFYLNLARNRKKVGTKLGEKFIFIHLLAGSFEIIRGPTWNHKKSNI